MKTVANIARIKRTLAGGVAIAAALLLSACASNPITAPPGLSCGSLLPLKEQVTPANAQAAALLDDVIAAKRAAAPGQPVTISILAMSGGGKYGAFGAGFLAGWSDAERRQQLVPIRREEIDIVTGISTGSLLASYAAVGNLSPAQGGSDEMRRQADADAKAAYEVSDRDLFRKQGLIAAVTSNGLADPTGLLDTRISQMVEKYSPLVARLPADHKVLVGAANLTNGKFYVADMREVANKGAAANACYSEWLLASSAVPAQFPPRYIDDHGYVDGGVRFGTFLGNNVQRVVRRTRTPGDPIDTVDVKINLIALFNNPLTANNPAKDPAAALACDQSTLETAHQLCPDRSNDLLDIVTRSAGDIMTHQLFLDSLYRLQRELEAAGVLGISKFIYAAPERIAGEQCRAVTGDTFDRGYMDCLYKLGFKTAGDVSLWQDFDEVPKSARALPRRGN
ncbi:hypothetical protein ACFB49_07380 [Sphingomonas sp. DBB INV C78]|uniref:patatin-like phospholipase family protein n=1 Tax=Sphingomonas sp. DBB INV C78 TaxID=3349434 RepID=UPI0036D426A6